MSRLPCAPDHRDASTRQLLRVVRQATARPHAQITSWRRRPLEHRIENLTTSGLDRVDGTLDDGTAWSVVVKELRPVSASPAWAEVPEEDRSAVMTALDWEDEPRIYRSALAELLPNGLRMPLVHAIDRGDDRWTIWMEDVADVTPWNLDRYHRTAASLGRLAARWPDRTATTTLGIGNRDIAPMFFGKIAHVDLVLQRDDKFWQQPSVATVVDANHRCDLFRLAELMPALLGRLAEVPTALCHGDATPDNFREPAAGGPIVALDWSYGSVGPVGSDLGQLLAGRFESGAARLEDVPAIARTVADGFSEGRVDVRPQLVELAWATYLAIRSVFSALVIDHRFDLDETGRHELLVGRAAVARFGLDLALRHATS